MKSARGKSERDQWIEIKRKITSYNANIYLEQGFELFKRGIDKKLIGPIDSIIKLRNHHG